MTGVRHETRTVGLATPITLASHWATLALEGL